MKPVIFDKAPAFESLVVPAVWRTPLDRFTVPLAMVAVPVAAPIFKVVAAPKALTVVALVLKTSNELEPVVMLVVIEGDVPKTATPVPVSSERVASKSAEAPVVANWEEALDVTNLLAVKAVVTVPVKVGASIVGEDPNTKAPEPVSSVIELAKAREAAVEVKFDEPSVKTALEAVKPERVIVPEEAIPVAPEIAPAAEISKVGVFKKLVNPAPPEFVIKIASVTTVVPAAVVSALSSLINAAIALSVVLAVNWF